MHGFLKIGSSVAASQLLIGTQGARVLVARLPAFVAAITPAMMHPVSDETIMKPKAVPSP